MTPARKLNAFASKRHARGKNRADEGGNKGAILRLIRFVAFADQ